MRTHIQQTDLQKEIKHSASEEALAADESVVRPRNWGGGKYRTSPDLQRSPKGKRFRVKMTAPVTLVGNSNRYCSPAPCQHLLYSLTLFCRANCHELWNSVIKRKVALM